MNISLTNNFDEGLKVIGGTFRGYGKAFIIFLLVLLIAYLIVKYKIK
jgi:hypothetical protein